MNSEDCSITEKSSLHVERGQKNNATHPHFHTHHEGSLQVPIPCAVMNVVFVTILIIALVALSVGQYNCPGHYKLLVPSDSHASSCSDDWVVYQRKCYLFSTMAKSWSSAQQSCSKDGATLAVIDSEKDKIFLKRYAGRTEHWVGLNSDAGQTHRWSDGKEFNSRFNHTGSKRCRHLNSRNISLSECERNLHWICSKPSR